MCFLFKFNKFVLAPLLMEWLEFSSLGSLECSLGRADRVGLWNLFAEFGHRYDKLPQVNPYPRVKVGLIQWLARRKFSVPSRVTMCESDIGEVSTKLNSWWSLFYTGFEEKKVIMDCIRNLRLVDFFGESTASLIPLLQHCERLEELILGYNLPGGVYIKLPSNLSSLTSLTLKYVNMEPETLRLLPNLIHLSVDFNRAKGFGQRFCCAVVVHCRKLTSIEMIYFRPGIMMLGLYFRSLKSIKCDTFRFDWNDDSNKAVAHYRSCEFSMASLEELSIFSDSRDTIDLTITSHFSALIRLSLWEVSTITQLTIRTIMQLPLLRDLSLEYVHFECMECLREICAHGGKLEALTWGVMLAGQDDLDCSQLDFSKFTRLNKLKLHNVAENQLLLLHHEQFQSLLDQNSSTLTELHIEYNVVEGDIDFQQLTRLTSLKGQFPLSDASLLSLSQYCPLLTSLDVNINRKCSISDVGLSALFRGCPLRSFRLENARDAVSDDALKCIPLHCRSLRKFQSSRCAFSEAALRQLKRDLPMLAISSYLMTKTFFGSQSVVLDWI